MLGRLLKVKYLNFHLKNLEKLKKQNKVCLKKRIRIREEINKMGEDVNVFYPNGTHSAYCNVESSAAHGSLNAAVWVGRMSWLPA